jgi:hypothetical protein
MSYLLWTGQTSCHDLLGREIPCAGAGQDGAFGAPLAGAPFRAAGVQPVARARYAASGMLKSGSLAAYPE